jgi:hypothetical protein
MIQNNIWHKPEETPKPLQKYVSSYITIEHKPCYYMKNYDGGKIEGEWCDVYDLLAQAARAEKLEESVEFYKQKLGDRGEQIFELGGMVKKLERKLEIAKKYIAKIANLNMALIPAVLIKEAPKIMAEIEKD